jgi:hypothetical protein
MRRRDERLCDKIIKAGGPNGPFAAKVRQAEKFSFDAATTTRACVGIVSAPPTLIEEAIPDLAILPYRLCWFEWHLTTAENPDLFLTEGFLVEADETLQRGVIWHVGDHPSNGLRMPDFQIGFDFTRDYDGKAGPTPPAVLRDNILHTQSDSFITNHSNSRVISHYSIENHELEFTGPEEAAVWRITSRFAMLVAPGTDKHKARELYATLMRNGFWGEMLGFIVLNLPKEKQIIEVTKEDLTEYNRQRRRLGQHKSQRQSCHLVTISTTKTEPSEELAAILAEMKAERDPRASPGEHDVRGHYRTYRNGSRVWIDPHKRGEGPLKSIRAGYRVQKQAPRRSVLTTDEINNLGI